MFLFLPENLMLRKISEFFLKLDLVNVLDSRTKPTLSIFFSSFILTKNQQNRNFSK